jgi:hypothetical protein
MGVALNFNKLAGYKYIGSAQEAARQFDVPQVVALLEECDFLGFRWAGGERLAGRAGGWRRRLAAAAGGGGGGGGGAALLPPA